MWMTLSFSVTSQLIKLLSKVLENPSSPSPKIHLKIILGTNSPLFQMNPPPLSHNPSWSTKSLKNTPPNCLIDSTKLQELQAFRQALSPSGTKMYSNQKKWNDAALLLVCYFIWLTLYLYFQTPNRQNILPIFSSLKTSCRDFYNYFWYL